MLETRKRQCSTQAVCLQAQYTLLISQRAIAAQAAPAMQPALRATGQLLSDGDTNVLSRGHNDVTLGL